jgi:hypothetical protein
VSTTIITPSGHASGWIVLGRDRGYGQPPTPPPAELAAGLLDRDQAAALDSYRAVVDRLDESRAKEAELLAAINVALADDLAAADAAWASGEATSPPSVRWTREAALDAQQRHSAAGLAEAEALLGNVHAVLATPDAQRRLVETAWSAVVDNRKPSAATSRRPLEALLWALNLDRGLAPSDRSEVLARFDALPALRWQLGWEHLLDDLGPVVADKITALTADADQ